jgi:hypothetical protein
MRIAPLPERKAASHSSSSTRRGASENIRIGHDGDSYDRHRGYDNEDGSAAGMLFEPVITARYPPIDRPDQPLNPMIPKFCHPQGDGVMPSDVYRLPTVHYFVLTDSRGGKMYGTCLTVHEEVALHATSETVEIVSGERDDMPSPVRRGGQQERGYVECTVNDSRASSRSSSTTRRPSDRRRYYAPRVLCLLSSWPYLTAFRTYLTRLYKLATTTDLMTAPLERYILNICSEVPAPPPGSFQVNVSILDAKIG